MTLLTLCAMCSGPATHTCMKCGKMVCEAHFVVLTGVCIACMGVMARGKK